MKKVAKSSKKPFFRILALAILGSIFLSWFFFDILVFSGFAFLKFAPKESSLWLQKELNLKVFSFDSIRAEALGVARIKFSLHNLRVKKTDSSFFAPDLKVDFSPLSSLIHLRLILKKIHFENPQVSLFLPKNTRFFENSKRLLFSKNRKSSSFRIDELSVRNAKITLLKEKGQKFFFVMNGDMTFLKRKKILKLSFSELLKKNLTFSLVYQFQKEGDKSNFFKSSFGLKKEGFLMLQNIFNGDFKGRNFFERELKKTQLQSFQLKMASKEKKGHLQIQGNVDLKGFSWRDFQTKEFELAFLSDLNEDDWFLSSLQIQKLFCIQEHQGEEFKVDLGSWSLVPQTAIAVPPTEDFQKAISQNPTLNSLLRKNLKKGLLLLEPLSLKQKQPPKREVNIALLAPKEYFGKKNSLGFFGDRAPNRIIRYSLKMKPIAVEFFSPLMENLLPSLNAALKESSESSIAPYIKNLLMSISPFGTLRKIQGDLYLRSQEGLLSDFDFYLGAKAFHGGIGGFLETIPKVFDVKGADAFAILGRQGMLAGGSLHSVKIHLPLIHKKAHLVSDTSGGVLMTWALAQKPFKLYAQGVTREGSMQTKVFVTTVYNLLSKEQSVYVDYNSLHINQYWIHQYWPDALVSKKFEKQLKGMDDLYVEGSVFLEKKGKESLKQTHFSLKAKASKSTISFCQKMDCIATFKNLSATILNHKIVFLAERMKGDSFLLYQPSLVWWTQKKRMRLSLPKAKMLSLKALLKRKKSWIFDYVPKLDLLKSYWQFDANLSFDLGLNLHYKTLNQPKIDDFNLNLKGKNLSIFSKKVKDSAVNLKEGEFEFHADEKGFLLKKLQGIALGSPFHLEHQNGVDTLTWSHPPSKLNQKGAELSLTFQNFIPWSFTEKKSHCLDLKIQPGYFSKKVQLGDGEGNLCFQKEGTKILHRYHLLLHFDYQNEMPFSLWIDREKGLSRDASERKTQIKIKSKNLQPWVFKNDLKELWNQWSLLFPKGKKGEELHFYHLLENEKLYFDYFTKALHMTQAETPMILGSLHLKGSITPKENVLVLNSDVLDFFYQQDKRQDYALLRINNLDIQGAWLPKKGKPLTSLAPHIQPQKDMNWVRKILPKKMDLKLSRAYRGKDDMFSAEGKLTNNRNSNKLKVSLVLKAMDNARYHKKNNVPPDFQKPKISMTLLWKKEKDKEETALHLSTSLKKTLLLSEAYIQKGFLDVNVKWRGSPLQFEFKKLDGYVDAYIKDATVFSLPDENIKFLNFFSKFKTSKFLTLPFSKVQSNQVLNVSDAEASFEIKKGIAQIKIPLRINSNVVDLTIEGKADLSQKSIDQLVGVRVNVEGGLNFFGVLLAPLTGGLSLLATVSVSSIGGLVSAGGYSYYTLEGRLKDGFKKTFTKHPDEVRKRLNP